MDKQFWKDSEKKIVDDHLEVKMIICISKHGDKASMLTPEGMTPMQAAKLIKIAAEIVARKYQEEDHARKNPIILDPKRLRPEA